MSDKVLLIWILLHYVQYQVKGQCTIGSVDYNTVSSGESQYGLFLNLANPITACGLGQITTIKYAFYHDQPTGVNQYQLSFVASIWRPESPGQTYNKIFSHSITDNARGNIAGVQTGTLSLASPLIVYQNDVIGLYITQPSQGFFAILRSGSGSDRLCMANSDLSVIDCSSQSTILMNRLLRITATVAPITCSVTELANGFIVDANNMTITAPSSIDVFTVIHYMCNNGYELDGSFNSTCMVNSSLDNQPPVCIYHSTTTSSDINIGLTTTSSMVTSSDIESSITTSSMITSSDIESSSITTSSMVTSSDIESSITTSSMITSSDIESSSITTSSMVTSSDIESSITTSSMVTSSMINSIDIFVSTSTVTSSLPSNDMSSVIAVSAVVSIAVLICAIVTISVVIVCVLNYLRYKKKLSNNQGFDNPMNEAHGVYMYEMYENTFPNKEKALKESVLNGPLLEVESSNVRYTDMYYSIINDEDGYSEVDLQKTTENEKYYETPVITQKSNTTLYYQPANEANELQLQLQNVETIHSNDIKFVKLMGSGQFGDVYKAIWNTNDDRNSVDVAVKTLKDSASDEERVKFLQEAAIMAQFSNPSVLKLLGIAEDCQSPMLITELMENGDLRSYLISLREKHAKILSLTDNYLLLLNFCQQICLGMTYLSNKGFIHRDLAARNILISKDKICKIADFGMSRDLEDENYYHSHGGMIPVKWTAPEAIQYRRYSTASDVWSYGCVLYEIWSLGHKPYEQFTNVQTIDIISQGYRLPPPPGCPRIIYEIMISTWHPVPKERPSFHDLILLLIQQNDQSLMGMPDKDSSSHPQAGMIGADLVAGEKMYQDLQNTYKIY